MHPDRKLVIHRIWRAMKACLRIIEETKDFMQQRKRNGLQAAIMRSYRNNMHFERHADGGSDVMTSESCILCRVSGKKCTVRESASKAQQVAKPFKLHIPEHQVACASRKEICHPPSAAASAFRALLQGRASQKVLSRDLYITQYEPIMENSISQHVPSAEQVDKRNTSLHYATGHATYPDYLRELCLLHLSCRPSTSTTR